MKTIRQLRSERGWTQFQLALAVGVQPQTVYLWESGRRMPQVPQLRKLGEVFGLCSDEIALEPATERRRSAPRLARADRHPGESAAGQERDGRALTRGAGGPAIAGEAHGDERQMRATSIEAGRHS
jgi:DNA-binding XRE family transcriptional regulator